jgi:hypothetical protein
MKHVFTRTSLAAAPMIALAVFGATTASAAPTPTAPPTQAAPMLGATAPGATTPGTTTPGTTTPGAPDDAVHGIIKAGLSTAGSAWGLAGVAISQIPLIGPIIAGIGKQFAESTTQVPILGQISSSAVRTYHDSGK